MIVGQNVLNLNFLIIVKIQINIMLFNLKIQKQQNNEFVQPKNANDVAFLLFLEAVQTDQSYNLVYLQQAQAQVHEKQAAPIQNKIKTILSIQKKHKFIQLVCSGQISQIQGKSMDKKICEALQLINQQQQLQLHAIKVYYDSHHKLIKAQANIYQEMVTTLKKEDLRHKFIAMIKQLFKITRQFQNTLIHKEKQRQAKIIYQINKLKEIFEENRIRRPKSTKICLLSKYSQKIGSKVVMDYLGQIKRNTPFARQLYAKFKQKSSKLDKQETDHMKKLNELIQTRKMKEDQTQSQQVQSRFKSSTLLKPIALEQEIFLDNLEQGGFGQVQKYSCSYTQLSTCCVESQNMIEEYWAKNNIKVQIKHSTEVLVKKIPLNTEFGLSSFQIELACIGYLRNQSCEQIAQYYHPVNLLDNELSSDQQFSQSNFLYSKYYGMGLSDFQHSNSEVRVKIVQDLLEGIRFLIKFSVLHRDLKPSNIKMTQKGRVKIIDFGSSCLNYSQDKLNHRFCFSPTYTLQYAKAHLSHMSQDQFTSHQFYDLYACGKIIQKFFSKNQGDPSFLIENIKYLYDKCMEHNPEDRLHPTEGLALLQTLLKLFSTGYQK